MYLDFFGLKSLPFRLRTDSRGLFVDTELARARDALLEALRQRTVIMLCGVAGVGKSTLLEDALRETHRSPVLRVHQPLFNERELRRAIVYQLLAEQSMADQALTGEAGHADLRLEALLERLPAATQPALLVLDHAHALPRALLDWLIPVCRGQGKLDVVLVGRCGGPGLPDWASVGGPWRDTAPILVEPLSAARVAHYIETRLRGAGAGGRADTLFTADACAAVHRHSRGIPRLINRLCDLALMQACTRGAQRVDESEITAATREPQWAESLSRSDDAATPEGARRDAMADAATDDDAPLHDPQSQAANAQFTATAVLQDPPRVPARPARIEPTAETPGAARIQVLREGTTLVDLRLPPGRLRIGRTADNDLMLESEYVSRRHCELLTVVESGTPKTTLQDLGSRNGTFVNGHAVKRVRLRSGDEVVIGSHVLRYFA